MKKIVIALVVLIELNSVRLIAQSDVKYFQSVQGISQKGETESVEYIGSRLELFVDNHLIDSLVGFAELRLHQPELKEIVLTFDQPWEGNCGGYRSIFFDGIRYRMYYNTYDQPTQLTDKLSRYYTCYAESYDGIVWHKPNLGLYEFNGSKDNNIVFINGEMGGVDADGIHFAVFKDNNPDTSPDAQYKAIMNFNGEPKGLVVYKSSDGFNWTPMTDYAVITNGAFDSQNLAFWDENIGEYRAYWRSFIQVPEGTDKFTHHDVFPGRIRAIRTARSKDLINWSEEKDLVFVDSPPEHLYTNVIKPYYRASHILIGFPQRYIDRGWSNSMKALPELEDRIWRSNLSPRFGTVLTEPLFMASRDGVLFNRWNEAFLRPGIERKGTWNYGHQYMGWSIIETESSYNGAPNELSFYTYENFRSTTENVAMRRHTLRVDGFVSVSAPMEGGELISKPIKFTGENLFINFSSSAAGDIMIEILDQNGLPYPGFALDDCDPVFGDSIERVISWKGNTNLSELVGETIKLRFILKDADLYSFQFK